MRGYAVKRKCQVDSTPLRIYLPSSKMIRNSVTITRLGSLLVFPRSPAAAAPSRDSLYRRKDSSLLSAAKMSDTLFFAFALSVYSPPSSTSILPAGDSCMTIELLLSLIMI